MGQPEPENRWKDRRVLAAALGTAIVVLPLGCSVGAALLVEHLAAEPDTAITFGLWWVGVLALSTLVFVAVERLARKALPLKVLLRMGLAFPGQAPKRLALARRAASVRDLDRRVAEARLRGMADEPSAAAEKIVTLAASLGAHDRTTRGHAERVRALTDMIADELRLPAIDRDRLRWSALLHDIGKLAVHPDILNKKGALDPAEWEIIRLHPLEGARLTSPISGWLGPWANTIAEHHERFDGTGYPAGLGERQISLGGRIVAVADSYDVMTSLRSYKKPVSPEAARRELAACAGTQFDPEVVRAFLAVSLWRLRLAAPLSWLGSLGPGRLFGGADRLGALTTHSLLGSLAAGAGVLGLTVASPLAAAHVSAPAGRDASGLSTTGPGPGGTTPATARSATGGGGGSSSSATSSHGGGGTHGAGPSSSNAKEGTTTSTSDASAGGKSTTTSTTSEEAGSAANAGGGSTSTTSEGAGSAASSTTAPGASTTTTTTGTGVITTTTTGPPATTTTTQPPAPPAPPSGLRATASCQVVVVGPEVSLTWTDSSSSGVTSYLILRSTNGTSYASMASVTPGSTTYTDTTVTGLGTTYWYEVEAVAASGSAASAPASATTPALCL